MNRLRHAPIDYEPTPTVRHRAGPEKITQHKWVQIMAYYHCPDCGATALKREDGQLIGLDSRLEPRPAVNLLHCDGNKRKRLLARLGAARRRRARQ